MSAVVLAPHHDDESLFAAFTVLREQAHVIVVLRSDLQEMRGNGITDAMRQLETSRAVRELGGTVEFWPYSDAGPDWAVIRSRLVREVIAEKVYAPAIERGGHEQHSGLGRLAADVWRDGELTHYLTYTDGRDRSISDRPVPYEPGWISAKFRALAHYESQIKMWPHHFLENQAEFYA